MGKQTKPADKKVATLASLSSEVRQYLVITGNYWAFTLTDGALRMLVVLHFHQLGFSPLEIAMMFLFYEVFGVITNLVGGWLGARLGLNKTMNAGLALQIIALGMLLVPPAWLTVLWVMCAQALSGIAKDLNKMSAKSAIKLLVPDSQQQSLFKWVALLTGSKNALKGLGFFMGGALLTWLGFHDAILSMLAGLTVVCLFSLLMLKQDLGKSKAKPRISQLFSKSSEINYLSAARLFLFAARDVWFVIALPVFLASALGWDHWMVGSFLAIWIIGYGIVQSSAPAFTGRNSGMVPDGNSIVFWAGVITAVTLLLSLSMLFELSPWVGLIPGLLLFGIVFAINSSLHSYLIVSYSDADKVSMDVGFYYMANAMGRLIGTVLSGALFQSAGLLACLIASTLFLGCSTIISTRLPVSTDRR